ncbi:hypothetical protein UFOVP146_2 [uncultured Caudovirales phage]|uniref:Uncharacterized protein n=1 Tax=uncultured Caudovirales phage TaxID=2100421 RepID=A0A6J7VN88_9CAUD|nr:hypothetical protein UFOVP146_2 [uncultured Caudovirales phage]
MNEPSRKAEPVAYIDPYDLERLPHYDCHIGSQQLKNGIPLYTHPLNPKYDPETGEPLIDGYPLFSGLPHPVKELTDEEIEIVKNESTVYKGIYDGYGNGVGQKKELDYKLFARAIIRKAQEK